jgi:hypothetical protein
MRTLDTVMTPLRASRTALAPYFGNIQNRYADAGRYARTKAHYLVERAPKSVGILANRYVLISLAAGACLLVMRRLQKRRQLLRRAVPKTRQHAARAAATPRKAGRTARGARVH